MTRAKIFGISVALGLLWLQYAKDTGRPNRSPSVGFAVCHRGTMTFGSVIFDSPTCRQKGPDVQTATPLPPLPVTVVRRGIGCLLSRAGAIDHLLYEINCGFWRWESLATCANSLPIQVFR